MITGCSSTSDVDGDTAAANPSTRFQAFDYAPSASTPNLGAQTHASDRAAFLAGYIAVATSKTGTVGVFGGIDVAPVEGSLDGFVLGVAAYDADKAADVQAIGWNVTTRFGEFIGSFSDTSLAQTEATSLIGRGADIVFPVAGGAGYGAADAVVVSGGG